MSTAFLLLFVLGIALELLLLWRFQRGHLWQLYPFLSSYLLYVTARTFILFGVMKLHPSAYRKLYWHSEVVALLLCFFVIWEVFRQAFPARLTIHGVVSKGLLLVLLCLAIASVMSSRNLAILSETGEIYLDLERKLGCIQAVLMALLLLAARYYRVPLGRNVWGMTLGFGIYASISTANFAAVELLNSFFPYWEFIRPASFVAMLCVWTWAFWIYAPNPAIVQDHSQDAERYLSQWKKAWSQILIALRKVHNTWGDSPYF